MSECGWSRRVAECCLRESKIPSDRKFAVKRLRAKLYDSGIQEIELLVQLNEPSLHVARYHLMDEDSEFICLVSQLSTVNLPKIVLELDTRGFF